MKNLEQINAHGLVRAIMQNAAENPNCVICLHKELDIRAARTYVEQGFLEELGEDIRSTDDPNERTFKITSSGVEYIKFGIE